MRHDIQQNERAFSTKEVAEEVGIATTTVRRYGQILERNGYEFFKDGDRRIFVKSDVESIRAIKETSLTQDEAAQEVVAKQKEMLSGYNERAIATAGTYNQNLSDPKQTQELLQLLATELAASREMNVQLKQDMDDLKTTVSRLQQDHHVISSGVGNFSQKTHTKMDKMIEEQKTQYETLLEQEREKSEALQQELRQIREDQQKEWEAQTAFNQQLEVTVKNSKSPLERLLNLFRK
ncbi:winged helix-turn-helix domain-containing protein [Pontibacillus salipaludis]|uniref:winged helix-turn-helix domain-containing protein n=1 Tax=Pontibacillus salipaludis TaxID=1697394 RepID=UPI0031EA817B